MTRGLAILLPVGVLLLLVAVLASGEALTGPVVLRFLDLPVHLLTIGCLVIAFLRAAGMGRTLMVRAIAVSGVLASLAQVGFRISALTDVPLHEFLAECLQFLSFCCLIGGITASLPLRSGYKTVIIRLADTASIGIAIGLLVWYFALRDVSYADSPLGATFGPIVDAAYPAVDCLLLLVLIDHVRLGHVTDRRLVGILSAVVGSLVFGDVLYNVSTVVESGPGSVLYLAGDCLWGLATLGFLGFGLGVLRAPDMLSSDARAASQSWIQISGGPAAIGAFVITGISDVSGSNDLNRMIWVAAIVLIFIIIVIRQFVDAAATKEWLEAQNEKLRARIEERTAELARKTVEAESAARVKGDFLANISHEFRTPLNGVVGSLALLSAAELPKAQRELLDRATTSADTLSRMINDVLDYVKLETEVASTRQDDFGVSSMFGFLRSRFGAAALQKRLDLRFVVAPDVPASISGDRYRLSQSLLQLVDNAIRFTATGAVTVSVRKVGANEANSRVQLEFCIRDTGPGISQQDVERIFRGFEQADNSSTRQVGGAGLGLAICARIARLLGGRIWVESVVGEGSAFFLQFDFGVVAESAESVANPAARLSGARLLLVEDNPLNREIATNILASAGIDVVIAEHGREALDVLARDAHIDGILMDIHMPVMDGYAATRAIRAQERFRELPIIAVTANVMLANTADAMAVGMNDCVPKPLKPTLLFETLARWIRPSGGTDGVGQTAAAAVPGVATAAAIAAQEGTVESEDADAQETLLRIPGVDVEKALGQALNDIGFYRRMLRRFIESHAEFKTEFRAAQVGSDPTAALRCAHTLKGNAANIGATALQVAAGELEDACRNEASVDTIERAFKETVAQLSLVLDGIGKVGIAESDAAASQSAQDSPQIEAEELAEQLATIRSLLSDSDPAATDLLLKLLARVRDTSQVAALRLAANAAENFEFEEALLELQSIQTSERN